MKQLSKKKINEVRERSGNKCHYCSFIFLGGETGGQQATVDHLTPKKQKGSNHIENLVLCCKSCNSRKGSMNENDFKIYNKIKQSKKYLKFLNDKEYYSRTFLLLKSGKYF